MMHHATHQRLTADSMRGCLEICGSVRGAAFMLNIGCRADVGCLAICISVRGAAFMLNIGCRSDAGLPRDMRICMRGCNAGCGSNARLPRNLRICTRGYIYAEHRKKKNKLQDKTRMWANAQRDGRPVEYRWCPLVNAITSAQQ